MKLNRNLLIILIAAIIIITITGCSNKPTGTVESYEEIINDYDDVGDINDEMISIVWEFFSTATRIENKEDDIDQYIEDNLEDLEQVRISYKEFREMILAKAESDRWDNRDFSEMILILDNIKTVIDALDDAYVNLDESNIYQVMMDIGVVQDLLFNNSELVEENKEVFYYKIQNY